MRSELSNWRGRKACIKRELLSLRHPGSCLQSRESREIFCSETAGSVNGRDHHIQLNRDARSDIEWCFRFSAEWNGTPMIQGTREVEASLTSDASGQWGCGGFSGSEWFMLQWTSTYRECHITVKELVPIVIAASVWGRRWRGKTIRAWCDTQQWCALSTRAHHGIRKPCIWQDAWLL